MADYSETKNRLDEIKDTIKDNKLSLDESLDLYEEAVKLGLEASNNVEQVLAQEEAAAKAEEDNDTNDAAQVEQEKDTIAAEQAEQDNQNTDKNADTKELDGQEK